MRTLLISLAAAASALAFSSPASAQYYPQPQGYGYGQGYGQNNYGQIRRLQAQIDRLQRLIHRLDRRDAIRDRQANRLYAEARDIERRLHGAARNGLNQRERFLIEQRIGRLEQRLAYAARHGQRWGYYDQRFERDGRWDVQRWDREDRRDDRRWDRDDDDDDRDGRRSRRGRDRD